jgi:uncharacterized membrane protein YuzA (DUF378 family)
VRNPYDWIGRLGILLAIIGAVNWLLVGLFEWNLVKAIFSDSGTQTATGGERTIYIIVGIGGLIAIPMLAATLTRMRGTRSDYGYGDVRSAGTRTQDELEEERRRRAA